MSPAEKKGKSPIKTKKTKERVNTLADAKGMKKERSAPSRTVRHAEPAVLTTSNPDILQDLPDPMCAIDQSGVITAWNHAMEELTGVPAGEMVGKGDYEYAVPFYGERQPILIDIALNPDIELPLIYNNLHCDGKVVTATTGHARPKGKAVTLWGRAIPITDETGTVIGAIMTIRDVTEHKQAESALQESEERFKNIFVHASEGILIADISTRKFLHANPAICMILGYSPEELASMELKDIHREKDFAHVQEEFIMLARGEKKLAESIPVLRKDGVVRYVDIGASQIMIDGHPCNLGIFTDITERKRAEESLRESEEKYRALVNFGLDPVVIFDGTGKTLFVNKASASLLGTDDVMALHGKNVLEFIAPESQADVIKDFEQVMQGNDAYLALYKVRTINGNEIWVESIGKRISFEGKPADLVSLRDITARKKTEDALRESEERFRTIIHSMQFGIVIIDAQTHTILDANEKALEMIGGGTDVIVGSVCHCFICPAESGRCPVMDLGQTVDSSERVLLTLRGEKIPILKSVITTTLGGKKVLIETFIDITDRKRAETALHIAQEKYTKAFLLAPDAITVSDLESGRFVEINEAASGIFGYPRDELIGKSSLELGIWQNKEARDAFIDQIRTQGRVVQFEVVERRKSGELFHASVTADTISIGTTRYLIATTRDITERKRVEQALKEGEERYSSLFTNSYSVSLLIDPDTGMIVDANDAACQYYGYSKEQLTSMGIFDLNRLPKEKVVRDLMHAKDAGAKHFFSTHFLANGERRNVEVFSGPIAVQGKPLFYSIIHDITDRVRVEQALLDSEAQMNAILQGSPIPKFVIDTRHRIISWNKALEEVSGIKAEDMLGTSLHWKAFYPEERPCIADLLVDDVIEKIPEYYEGKYAKSKVIDGAYEGTDFFPHIGEYGSWLFFTAAPILDSQGTIIGSVETLEDITERKRSEEEMRTMSQFQESIISNANVWLMVLDGKGNILLWNNAAVEISGYPSREVIGNNRIWRSLYPDADYRKKITDTLTGIIKEKMYLQNFETTINCKSGEQKVLLWNTRGLEVVKGQGARFVAIGVDITKSIRAEHALRESEERYRDVVEDQTEFICRFTPDGTLTFVNDAYCRYFQLNKNECIGKHHTVIIPPDDARKMKEHIKSLTPKNPVASIDHRIMMPNGEIRWQRWSDRAIFDTNGHVVEYQTVGRDITVQKQAEKALQDSERRLADIINFIPDATFAIDLEGKIIAWNRAIEEMTGVAADDMIGKGDHEYSIPFYGERRPITIDLIFGDTEEIRKMYPVVQKKEDKFTSEIYIQRLYGGKGSHLWFVAAPLYDTNGNITGAIESIRDVSDRKRAEEALIKFNEELEQRVKERTEQINASLEEKVVLLREVHHRVKNNLQIIISLLNLQSRYMTDENTVAAFRECQNRVKAMSLVHEKLYQSADISKIDLGNYVRFLGNSLFQFFGMKGTGVTFAMDIPDISLDINTAIPVGLIINELVSNSLKYAFPQERTGEISVAIRRENHTLSILFADNGVGIPADFDWRNAKSLGLQLVITLVDQLDGTIELDRRPGTAFTIVVKEKV